MVNPYRIFRIITQLPNGEVSPFPSLGATFTEIVLPLIPPYNPQMISLSPTEPIDAILLDLDPELPHPLQIFSDVQASLGQDHPPIVVLGGADLQAAIQLLKHGAADYLVKPQVTPEELQDALQTAIAKSQTHRQHQHTQQLFQASVDTMLDCFGIFSSIRDATGQIIDFRIDYLNPAACANNQMPKESQIGRGLCEVFPAHRESGLFAEYRQLVETGIPLSKDSLVYADNFGEQRLVRAFDIQASKLNDGFIASWRDITERKRLEIELSQLTTSLQKQQNRLQQLINNAPIGIGIGSATGEVRVINDAMLALHGYTRADFEQRGLNWRDFTPPEAIAETEQAMEMLREQGFLSPTEKELLRPDGSRVPIWISVMQWMDGTEEHVAFAVDLTPQKQAEAAIQQLNQDLLDRVSELQTLLELIPVGIAIASDRSCTHMQSNAYLRQILGVSADQNISKSVPLEEQPGYQIWQQDQEVPTDDLPMQTAGRLGVEVRDAEFEVRLADGTVRQILSYATPLPGKSQTRGVIGAFLDITERNQTTTALKASQQRYQELAEAMPQMVWTADATGAVNYCNQRWYEYTGYSEAQSMGLAGADVIHTLDRDRTLAQWQDAVTHSKPFEIEYRLRRQDGVCRWFINRGIPTFDQAGQVTGWIGTITDIHEQKQLAERLQLVLRAVDGLIYDWNLETNEVYRSEKLMDLIGLHPDQAPPQADWWANRIHPEDLQRLQPRIQNLLASASELYESEYRVWHEQGYWVDVWERSCLIRDSQGQTIRIVGSTLDISHRKQAERDLREAHIQLEAALAAGSIYTWRWNLLENQVVTNRNFAELLGLESAGTTANFPIEQFLHAVHPEDRDRVIAAFDEAITTGADLVTEYRILIPHRPETACRWVIARGSVEFDDHGQAIAFPGALADITDRKQAELERQRSEAILQAFIAASPITLALFDRELRFLYANEALAQMNERPLSEHLGHTLWEVVPQMAPQFAPMLLEIMETQQPVLNLEFNGEVQPGVFRSTIANHYPVCLPNGEVIGAGVAVMDITSLTQAQQELKDSEERFRTLADNISQFAWMADNQGWIFWYNQRWFDFTGTTLEQMQGWGWQQVHHPDHVERVVHKFRHCIQTGTTWEDTFPLRGDNGQYRWFLSRAIPLRDAQGQVTRWFGTNTDITELRQTELALRQTTERLNVALKSAPLTLFNQDLDRRYTWIYNPTHNFTVEDVIGKRDEDLTSPESSGRLIELKQQVLETGIGVREEVKISWEDCIRYYDLTVDPIRNPQNQIVGITCAAVDISDRKQLEAERERLFEQEQTAREAAERANRIKDEFLAVLSHELRSPLNPILGWTKLLQTRTFDVKQTREALATIERNAKLQAQLIDDLLDVARILRGKLSLNLESVNLAFVIEAAIETVRTTAAAKSITLHTELPNLGQVAGDAARLQQIIWNLLSNAIKFTPPGGMVRINSKQLGEQAEIMVQDTGKGINPEFLPYIFESFRQEDASTTRKYGGLGLGLAIVRQLIEAHGGTITAHSPGEGLGATFTLRLPLLKAEPTPQPLIPSLCQEPDLQGVRVLMVDDEPDARELMTVLLRQCGAQVTAVAAASQVLQMLKTTHFDVLISDIGMPEMDGYALIQQVRILPAEQGGQIPAIALTAYAGELNQQKAIAAGFQAHCAKPLEPELFLQQVVSLLATQACPC